MKIITILIATLIYSIISISSVFAQSCTPGNNTPCRAPLTCQPSQADPSRGICQAPTSGGNPGTTSIEGIFGKIKPPDELVPFTSQDQTGAGGIGKFFSNFIALIYSIASVVLILMLVWGAFDWLTSEGDKEKVENARRKIINAIIGITLFAVAFAVIQLIGAFTGFTFFVGQR